MAQSDLREWKKLTHETNSVWFAIVGDFLKFCKKDTSKIENLSSIAPLFALLKEFLERMKQGHRRTSDFALRLQGIAEDEEFSLKERVAIFRNLATRIAVTSESHMIHGWLWRVGLDSGQFAALCKATLSDKGVPLSMAAHDVFRCAIDTPHEKRAARQMLLYYLGRRPPSSRSLRKYREPFRTIFGEKDTTEANRPLISVPIIYYPCKTKEQKILCRNAKREIKNLDLSEDPI